MRPLHKRTNLEFLYQNVTTDRAKLAEMSCMAPRTFRRNFKILEDTGKLERRTGSGRPRTLTPGNLQKLTKLALENAVFSGKLVKRELEKDINIKIGVRTVYRNLAESGIVKKKARKIPKMTPVHKEKRENFCKNWNIEHFFDNVIISDESMVDLERNTLRQWSKVDEVPVKESTKFPEKLMIFGALSLKGFWVKILPKNTSVNSQKYIEIIRELIHVANKWYP